MTPDELIATACPTIASMGAAYYFVPETIERGGELGLDGFRFYFLGRGGVLGDVEPEVVASAFGYFEPHLVASMWNSARELAEPRATARAYFAACQDFGRKHFADLPELDQFCAAAGAVNEAADPTGLALYAGAAAEPMAEDLPARAMQLVTVLREFRGSAHLLAVVASGLEPKKAHYMRRPGMFSIFGYQEQDAPEITDDDRAKQMAADELTDRLVRPAYSVLDDNDADALVSGLERMEAAISLGG